MTRTYGITALALTLAALAQPAEARRFRFFGLPGFGRSETIDRVYDLPDEAPFQRDGDNLDVGYLHALSSANDGFVLYHGSKYVKLDAEGISLLTKVLGTDPTADYRAEHAAANAAAEAEAKAERAPFRGENGPRRGDRAPPERDIGAI